MSSLYELTDEYKKLFDMMESGEYSEEQLKDTQEAIGAEIDEKLDNTACFVKNLDSEIDAIDAEIDRLTERKKAKKNLSGRLKQGIFETLIAMGKKKFETARNCLTIAKKPPSVLVADEEKFIEWAKKNNVDLITYKDPAVNKTAIKDLLKSEQIIPYCTLEQGETLRIK